MKIKSIFTLSLSAFFMLISYVVDSAERKEASSFSSELLNSSSGFSTQSVNDVSPLFGLSSEHSLLVRRSYQSNNGDLTTRYQQKYRGIPVIGDDVIVSRRSDNSFKLAYGSVLSGIVNDISDVTPNISIDNAIDIARYNGLARVGIGADKSPVFENQKARLAIWQDDAGLARLVYEVSYMLFGKTPSRPHYIIDAKTGEVLQFFDNLQTANGGGPGGNQKTGKYEYGLDYAYMEVSQSGNNCSLENTNVKTINLNHGTSGSQAWIFPCYTNITKEINGAYSPLNDAHFFGGVIFDMYNDWINTAPLTFQLEMRVHYSSGYENAFWDGRAMTFGDGASRFYPLVSLDVSAHEVSHGYTEQNSNLVYSNKSGGLNESFSDIAGEAAEFYMTGANDWLVGEQIFKSSGALRYMADPTRDGVSIGHQSDYYSGMDVHYSSGVFNKAFYLLANKAGWDTKKAFIAYATANKLYWSSNTNWNNAGGGVMDAACDLGYNPDDVKDALASVGVISTLSAGSACGDGTGGGEPPPGMTELENGVPVTGLSAATGDDMVFFMNVPSGSGAVTFTMSGGSGDADLYVQLGSEPTDTDWDCRPYRWGNNETCTGTSSGTYYVRIKAYSAFSGVSIVGDY